jgi:hypothetical protein
VLQLLVTANLVPSSPIILTLMMEALLSSETSVLTRATRRHTVEGGVTCLLQNVCRAKPDFTILIGSPGKEKLVQESDRYGGHVLISVCSANHVLTVDPVKS